VDINPTVNPWFVGPTGGVQLNGTGVRMYGGIALGTAGSNVTIQRSTSSASTGLNIAYSQQMAGPVGPAYQGSGFGTPGWNLQVTLVSPEFSANVFGCR